MADPWFKARGNETQTITMFGLAGDKSNQNMEDFMRALLNIKKCNTLAKKTEDYKYYPFLKTDAAREKVKKLSERGFYMQLEVVIHYPEVQNFFEEYFDQKEELSGEILLDASQRVCIQPEGGAPPVLLRDLMLAGIDKDKDRYGASSVGNNAANFITLNMYLLANGLATGDDGKLDPRLEVQFYYKYLPILQQEE
jgi:hypothetical protein